MVTAQDLYHILSAVVPVYVPAILGYAAVKWWKLFSPDECSGINKFVGLFAVPLLSFHFISTNNPYAMNFRFIAADTLQKVFVLSSLAVWLRLSAAASLDWYVTLFSVCTLPNTLIVGIPILTVMYPNDDAASLMVQIVVLQFIIWNNVLLVLYELRAAKTEIPRRDQRSSQAMKVLQKLFRNPITYSTFIGVMWSFIAFKWDVEMLPVVTRSISIMADAGLGMAMFSLGLFMAMQPKLIACGKSIAAISMVIRFLAGPAVMAVASIAVGLRGNLLRIAIVQASLPVALISFVFAQEYGVQPDILSTSVIFGMLISLPITAVYFILLGL